MGGCSGDGCEVMAAPQGWGGREGRGERLGRPWELGLWDPTSCSPGAGVGVLPTAVGAAEPRPNVQRAARYCPATRPRL